MAPAFATLAARAASATARSAWLPTFRAQNMCKRTAPTLYVATYSKPRMMSTGTETDDTIMAGAEQKIAAALSPTRLEVTPTYGDPNGSHVSITVVSAAFEGINTIKRHQLVYKAIWEELSGPIHAVDELVTKTPEEDGA